MPIEEHLSCVQPADEDVPVWRFVSLSKYLEFLNSSTLHFARLDQFEDPYEGVVFGAHRAAVVMSDEKTKAIYTAIRRRNRARMYVNAWHLAEHEPAGMWKQYAVSEPALAVCSTYRKLKEVLNSSKERLYLGLVKYTEPPMGYALNPFDFVMSKRPSFEHEKEVRAFIWRSGHVSEVTVEDLTLSGPTGIKIQVDLNALVTDVRLSPWCKDEWLEDLLWAVNEKFGLTNMPVRQSTLYVDPDDDTVYY